MKLNNPVHQLAKSGTCTSVGLVTGTWNNSKKANVMLFGLKFLFATFNPHFPSLGGARKFRKIRVHGREIVMVRCFPSAV